MSEFKTVCHVGDLKEGEGKTVVVAGKLIAEYPKLNVLINNAGVMNIDDVSAVIDEKLLVTTLTTNVMGPIRLTGALIGPPDTVWPSSPGLLAGTRVLLTGSDADDWISEEQTRHVARVLEGLGADVCLRIYHGRPHMVCEDEMREARALLSFLVQAALSAGKPFEG